jgi:hypothetical protein
MEESFGLIAIEGKLLTLMASIDARHEITKADRLRDSRLEETRHEYDRRIRDRSQGVKKQGS